jgi:steroid Delta-isomerase
MMALSNEAARNERLALVTHYFETISAISVQGLNQIYEPDAYFKDPFNAVNGLSSIQHIFADMFVRVNEPQFHIKQAFWSSNDELMLIWDFNFRFKKPADAPLQCIRGTSHLRFGTNGKIAYHRDYWDAAEELYEKLPVLGAFMRWLKKRAQ